MPIFHKFKQHFLTFVSSDPDYSEDVRRRGSILKILLYGSITLSSIAFLVVVITLYAHPNLSAPISLYGTLGALLFFVLLLRLCQVGHVHVASYLFCFVYFMLASFMQVIWGILIPQGLLLLALAILTSSVLIGTRAALFFTLLSTSMLFMITHIGISGIVVPYVAWGSQIGRFSDAIVFSFTFFVLLITSWLSNREIDRSFRRAKAAEDHLRMQRDNLEVAVEQRTRELKERQRIEVLQLYEFAYFGRVTSSLLHDLANPVSTIAIALKRLETTESSKFIKRAISNTARIERFIENARNQLRHRQLITQFSPIDEINQACDSLSINLSQHDISLKLDLPETASLNGDPIKFFRLVSNLLSNAIDAHTERKEGSWIKISLQEEKDCFILSIADNGSGINEKDLSRIFEPFFTTKPILQGTGIGLSICKEIVEQDFRGSISVASNVKKGTTFSVSLYNSAVLIA